MRKKASRIVIAALLCGAAPGIAHAQTAGVAHPKPVNTRGMCVDQPAYELVALSPPTDYRTTSGTAPGGYDPAAPAVSCGGVTRAQPLTCVDSSSVPVGNPELCATTAKSDYESKNLVTVQRGTAAGLAYYTVQSTTLGGSPLITGVRIKAGIVNSCIQVAELEAYEGGVNVALASNGGSAIGTTPWSGESAPAKAIDGMRPAGYPNIYHSQCSGGDNLVITFARPSRISKLTLYGRQDYGPERDLYGYELLSGSTVVGTGQIDARSGSGSASLAGSCEAEDFQWRKTKADVSGMCGTTTVQDTVQCVDASGGGSLVVDPSQCNANQRPANAPYSVTSREGCGYDYTATAWSVAPASCGAVTQSRTVRCVGSDGQPAEEAACANYLTAPSASTPATSYWSKGPYAWPGAPGNAITIYRMPSVCDVGSPDQVQKDCEARFVNKNGGSASYLHPRETRTVEDRRACTPDTPAGGTPVYAWNTPVYVPDRSDVCGPNTRSGRVFCTKDGTTEVADSFCSSATKPASVQNFDDTSGCKATPEIVQSIAEVRVNTCGYTSSGGGRYACGPHSNYRPGPAAPWPNEVCSGKVIAGEPDGFGDYQTPNAGKGWSKAPTVAKIPGARCVVHWKYGYSDSNQAGWNSVYYDGPPTGRAGGDFISKKP